MKISIPSSAAATTDHDPRRTAECQVKLKADLDGSPAFWTYFSVVNAARPDDRPLAMLGIVCYRAKAGNLLNTLSAPPRGA